MSTIVNKKLLTLALGVALAAASAFASEKEEHDEAVSWEKVPASVQTTITSEAKGGKVDRVEKESEHNKVTYEAKVTLTDGTKLKIKADASGKLISSEKGKAKDENDGDDDHHEHHEKKDKEG